MNSSSHQQLVENNKTASNFNQKAKVFGIILIETTFSFYEKLCYVVYYGLANSIKLIRVLKSLIFKKKRTMNKIESNFMNKIHKLNILRTVAACLGQMQMSEEQSKVVATYFQLNDQECLFLQTVPHKNTLNGSIPSDPLLYRLHEVIQSIPYVKLHLSM